MSEILISSVDSIWYELHNFVSSYLNLYVISESQKGYCCKPMPFYRLKVGIKNLHQKTSLRIISRVQIRFVLFHWWVLKARCLPDFPGQVSQLFYGESVDDRLSKVSKTRVPGPANIHHQPKELKATWISGQDDWAVLHT